MEAGSGSTKIGGSGCTEIEEADLGSGSDAVHGMLKQEAEASHN